MWRVGVRRWLCVVLAAACKGQVNIAIVTSEKF